jgi:hypothetical protein
VWHDDVGYRLGGVTAMTEDERFSKGVTIRAMILVAGKATSIGTGTRCAGRFMAIAERNDLDGHGGMCWGESRPNFPED